MFIFIHLLIILVFLHKSASQNVVPQIVAIQKNSNILQCPQPIKQPDPFNKRQLGGQYRFNNEMDSFSVGLWLNYWIGTDSNSQSKDYGIFYFSSDTTDISQEQNLRLLTVVFNEQQQGSTTITTVTMYSFTDILSVQISQSLQNQWVYLAATINLKDNRLELGIIYEDLNNSQIIINQSVQRNAPIVITTFPNIGLYPLWLPINELLCGKVYNFYFYSLSSFFQNDSQLMLLSQTTESEIIGHFALESNIQVQSQFEQNLNGLSSGVQIISGYTLEKELTNDVLYSQIPNLGQAYYPIIGPKNFFLMKQLNIENMMTLIFDYYTQDNVNDVIFISQSLARNSLRMFAVSQVSNSNGLFLNVTIEGQSIVFTSPLSFQQLNNIGLSVQCLPPFIQTTINLRINTDTFEQQILPNVCFNYQKTNQKMFIGFQEDISNMSDQFKIVSNLIIVKGGQISGIYSQIERKQNYRMIDNCEYMIQNTKKLETNKCLRCGGSYLLYKNRCVQSQDCVILDEITRQPVYSDTLGNNCFVDCLFNQIIKHDVLCDYDYIVEDSITTGQVNLSSDNPSFLVSNLTYTNIPQVFVGLNGLAHDGTTIGYNLSIQINNIQSTSFGITLVESTDKKYSSFILSYITAPSNSKKVEINQYQINDNDLVDQSDTTKKVYKIQLLSEKLYIPNIIVSPQNYQSNTNIIQISLNVINIGYSDFEVEVPQIDGIVITSIQYIAFKGKQFDKEYNFTNNDINGWGQQPDNSTFRYLNMLNYTITDRVDPLIIPFSMISGIIKSDEDYQGIDISIRNNTQINGKFVVDYVQANKSSLAYFKTSVFFLYKSCKVSACLYSSFDERNVLRLDTSLITQQDHPLQTGSDLRQFRNRIKFDKYFNNTPNVFLSYEQFNVPEENSNEGVQFELRAENINYDGFDLVYEVYNNFTLKSMSVKYFATEQNQFQIDSIDVSPDQLALQPTTNTSNQYFSIQQNFTKVFQSIPQIMISVTSYSGDSNRNLSYQILVDSISTQYVVFKLAIMPGILSKLTFQYIAAVQSLYNEIQTLSPQSFEDTPIGRNFDPLPVIPIPPVVPPNPDTSDPNITPSDPNTAPSDPNANTTNPTTDSSGTNTSTTNPTTDSSGINTNTQDSTTDSSSTNTTQNSDTTVPSGRRHLQTDTTTTDGSSTSSDSSGSSGTTTDGSGTSSTTDGSGSSTTTTTTTSSTTGSGTGTTTDGSGSGTTTDGSGSGTTTDGSGSDTTTGTGTTPPTPPVPEVVIMNNWLTKYWDRWSATPFQSLCTDNIYSSNPHLLYPIQSIQQSNESLLDLSFELKGEILNIQNVGLSYNVDLNIEREFINSLSVSVMSVVQVCPNWCVQCNEKGVCIQCTGSNQQLPNCTCKQGFIQDPNSGTCIQCIDGCCKSDLTSTICTSCQQSSLIKTLNCGCPTNQQNLYIAWKNAISLNVTLTNGGDLDSFTLLGCKTCTQVKTGRTIILNQTGSSIDNFAVYSSLGNTLGNLEYEVSILNPPQFICYGSIKSEKTFMIGLSDSDKSKATININHLQNSMSFCSDKTQYSSDSLILVYTPTTLNWQKIYNLRYQDHYFRLMDVASSLEIFVAQFYLTYNIQKIFGTPPNFQTKCDSYTLAKFGTYKNIKKGLNEEIVKSDSQNTLEIKKIEVFKNSFIYSSTDNIVIQGWFYIKQMVNGQTYALFELISEDLLLKIGVGCTQNAIIFSYENIPDTIYKKQSIPVITGVNNLGDQWFYISLEWLNSKSEAQFIIKLTQRKGYMDTNVRIYTEKTAPFIFQSAQFTFAINNGNFFQGSEWNGSSMDFGIFKLLNTVFTLQNSMAMTGLNLIDNIQQFQKTFSKILFYYEFTSYDFSMSNFVKDYSKSNNNFMDDQLLISIGYQQGIKVLSRKMQKFPQQFYIGNLNEDYGFVVGFTVIIKQATSFEGTILRIGYLIIRFALFDGPASKSSSSNTNQYYNLQFCVQEVECVNSSIVRIPINSSNAYGLAIQIRKTYIGNQRLLAISVYGEKGSELNIMFSSPEATTGFTSFTQTSQTNPYLYINLGSLNNDFIDPQNYIIIRRLVLQSGSYVSPYDILIQNASDDSILAQSSSTPSQLPQTEKDRIITLNRLKSLKCLILVGKEKGQEVCIKCNSNYENVFGQCVSNGECQSYSLNSPYEKNTNNGAYYFDYQAKKCLPCNSNCLSCLYTPDNCTSCSVGFVNTPLCRVCPYSNGNPTYFDPDTSTCVSQCSQLYCTDTTNLVCTKCDGSTRRLFEDFNTPSNSYAGEQWTTQNTVNDSTKKKVVSCFINNFFLNFFGGGGTLDGSTVIKKQISSIPLHYSIKYSFILLVPQANFTINTQSIANILQMKLDSNIINQFNVSMIVSNQMICQYSQISSSVFNITTTIAHIQSKAVFELGFNFTNQPDQSSSFWWGIRLFAIDILQCHYSCFTCSGPGESECLSCTDDLIFVFGKCLCSQSNQYLQKNYTCWQNPCYSCQYCSPPCSNCGSDGVCVQCIQGMNLYQGKCYSNCTDVVDNIRKSMNLTSNIIQGLCLPYNVVENITEFANNTQINDFKYTKLWTQSPIQTPGQYLFQCSSDNFVGPFSNSIFQKQFKIIQPYYAIKASIEALFLNSWQSNTVISIQINNQNISQILQYDSQTQQPYSLCNNYQQAQIGMITTPKYVINSPQIQISFISSGFDNSILWALRKFTLSANVCPVYCTVCSDSNICSACIEGATLNIWSNCACPDGYIYSLKQNCYIQPCGVCVACHQSCQKCSGQGPFQCTQCKDGYVNINSRCVEECPDNYYLDIYQNTCFQCDISCYNCLGPYKNECLSCFSPNVLQNNYCVQECTLPGQQLDTYSRACVIQVTPDLKIYLNDTTSFSNQINLLYSTYNPPITQISYLCGGQMFAGPFNNKVILKIPYVTAHSQLILSLDIFIQSSTTLSFNSNYSFLFQNYQKTISLQQTQSCQSLNLNIVSLVAYINSYNNGYSPFVSITITSSNSPFSFRNIQFQTIICHFSCLTCSGPEKTDCLSCISDATLQSDNSCQCTSNDYTLMFIVGSLARPIKSECLKCRYPCTSCFAQDNYSCMSCEEGFYLKDYSCVNSCPPLKYQQLDDQWLCQKCSFPCDECTSDGKNCINCLVGYVLTQSKTCESTCWDSQYVDSNNTCQMCDESCFSCRGPNVTDCINCNVGYYSDQSSGLCQPCNDFCDECLDATNLLCPSCQQGLIHYNNTICTQDCSEIPGTYPLEDNCSQCDPACKRCDGPLFSNCLQCQDGKALVDGICTPCNPACTSCFGTTIDTCYSCANGYFLQGNSCVLQCNSGYFGQNNVCVPCNAACSLCYGKQNDQCFSCNQAFYFINNTCIPCHPYCQICYGPLQTDCLYCKLGSYLLNSQCYGGADGCPSQYYGDNQTRKCKLCDPSCNECQGLSQYVCVSCPVGSFMTNMLYNMNGVLLPSSCTKCPDVCQSCTASTQCTLCITNYYLYNGSCLIDCPSGYYENIQSGLCVQCTNNCSTCSGYNSQGNLICSSCNLRYYLATDQSCQPCQTGCYQCNSNTNCSNCLIGYYNYQGTCLTQCPLPYYPSSKQECLQCVSPCNICTSLSMCLGCENGYFLQKTTNQFNTITSSLCQKCNSICLECVGGLMTDCTRCKPPLSLQNNVCQQQCNVGFFSSLGVCYPCDNTCLQCTSLNNCTLCKSGYFSLQGVCQQCNGKCLSCFGSTENQCYSCLAPYYLYQSSCILSCPDHFFKYSSIQNNQQLNICQKCSSSCLNCNGINENNCKSCINGFYLTTNNTCESCSTSCKNCITTSSMCTSCPLGQFLYNGICMQICPDTYYGDDKDNTCKACLSPCKTCLGQGTNQCLTCSDAFFFSSGTCVPCHPNCLSCYGVYSYQCYSCQLGMKKDGDSCVSCGDGQYYDPVLNSCQLCNSVCKTCYGSSFQNCLSCNTGKYLQDQKCNICPSSCSNCTDDNNCINCVNGFYLLKINTSLSVCIKQCPFGMEYKSSSQQCDCTQNCLICPVDPATLSVSCSKCIANNYVVDLFDVGSQYSCLDTSSCKGYVDTLTSSCIPQCASTAPFINTITRQCLQVPCPQGTVTLYISGQGYCQATCPANFFPNNSNVCSPCHPLCTLCTGPTASQCQQCATSILYHPDISTCNDTCEIGYIQDSQSGYCVVCYQFCKTCISNLVFLNGQCLDECPVGFQQTQSMICIQNSSQIVKISNKYSLPVSITKDVVIEASVFALGPVKSVEWILRKSTDQEFKTNFDLLKIDSLSLNIPYLALKASQQYQIRIEVVLASKDILNDEVVFTTAGEISSGSFVITPAGGQAGSTLFQFSIDKWKYPLALTYDISYYSLELQYSNSMADDGTLTKNLTPDFVKQNLVQIFTSVAIDIGKSSTQTYTFPMNFESDQNIACELKVYSSEGSVESYSYLIIQLKKSSSMDTSALVFSENIVSDAISFLNYCLNVREIYKVDQTKLTALYQNNNINLQIALSRQKVYNQNSQCDPAIDCFGQGECLNNSGIYSCSCTKGFLGVNCQWVDTDYLFLQANVPNYIQFMLSDKVTNYSQIIIAQSIGNIFYYSDFNTDAVDLSNLFISIAQQYLLIDLDQVQIQIFQSVTDYLISNLQDNFSTVASAQIGTLQTISQQLKLIVSKNINMGEALSQETPSCDSVAKPISVLTIDTSNSGTSSTPSGRRQLRRLQRLRHLQASSTSKSTSNVIPIVFRDLTVSIPPEIINVNKKIVVSGSSFKKDPRSNPLAITSTLSLSLGSNAGQESVSDAPQPIVLNIAKKVPSPPGTNPDAISCTYYDVDTNSFKSDGCTFVKETITNVVCSCTHLTDFSAALQPELIKTAISLTDMQAAQAQGNALIQSKQPQIISITNLPTPKLGQRNVNLINAVNIQMSGGVYNVLAKQVFIVTNDGENITAYNMWDSLYEESLDGLIKKAEVDTQQPVIAQSDNIRVGQYIIIGLTIFGILFKIGNRASFKFKFVEESEALPESVLNNIHKMQGDEDGQQNLDSSGEDGDEKIGKQVERNDHEYENSIVTINQRDIMMRNQNSPKEAVKLFIHDIQDSQSLHQSSVYQSNNKIPSQNDEVKKRTMLLKKKYEQEKRLQQMLEQVQEGNDEIQSYLSGVQSLNNGNNSPSNKNKNKIQKSPKQSPKFQDDNNQDSSPKHQASPYKTNKSSKFVKQVIEHDIESQASNQSKNKGSNQASPKNNEITSKIDKQPSLKKSVFQKIQIIDPDIDAQSIQSPSNTPKIKDKKTKEKVKPQFQQTQGYGDEHERVITTEADDNASLIIPSKSNSPKEKQQPVDELKKSELHTGNKHITTAPSKFKKMIIDQQVGQSQFSPMKELKTDNSLSQSMKTPRIKGVSHSIKQSTPLQNSSRNIKQNFSSSLVQSSFQKDSQIAQSLTESKKLNQEKLVNEIAILRIRENIEKQKQKITSKNINPLHSIFKAKETLFQTKMSRMLYFFITLYGYLAFDFYVYKWVKEHFSEQPFVNYLFYFNPYRIVLIVMLSNLSSHTFLGFINHTFSVFVQKLSYEQISIKMLNKLRSHHLLCFTFMFLTLYSLYSHLIYNFAQTQYFSQSELQEILLETVAAQFIDSLFFDGFLVLAHMVFIDQLPDNMPLKSNFETFQSQRGFFYTKKTEHNKVLDLIL